MPPISPKVKFVSVEQGINALGFRKVAAVARKLDAHTEIYFVTVGNLYSLLQHIFPNKKDHFDAIAVDAIVDELCTGDLICISSMSSSATHVAQIIKGIKARNPAAMVLWGGAHCIIYPDDAIAHADAIFTGEGEVVFQELYAAYLKGDDMTTTAGMWFKTPTGIVKNAIRPLCSNEMLSELPPIFHNNDCSIFDYGKKRFRPLTNRDYIAFNGVSYPTVWTQGCPHECIYCANNVFIGNDRNYRKIRHSAVDHIIAEIEAALRTYPFISTVIFYDDNFLSLPMPVLQAFTEAYSLKIGLPFVVFGMHPSTVREDKVKLLAEAGMNRCRMGIQSGNEKTLAFYGRKTSLDKISSSARILSQAARDYDMIPPAYDIIIDNPVETSDDVVASLGFLSGLDRPFTLNIFSLRVMPNTKLWDEFARNPAFQIPDIRSSYLDTKKTLLNTMFYLLGSIRLPQNLFLALTRRAKRSTGHFPLLHLLVKTTFLAIRAYHHLSRRDFTPFNGFLLYGLYKFGFFDQKRRQPEAPLQRKEAA